MGVGRGGVGPDERGRVVGCGRMWYVCYEYGTLSSSFGGRFSD